MVGGVCATGSGVGSLAMISFGTMEASGEVVSPTGPSSCVRDWGTGCASSIVD